MSDRMTWRERSAWLAVVVALAVSMAWIGIAYAIALLKFHLDLPLALTLGRALGRVVVALALRAWPVLPLVVLGGMMLALAVRSTAPARGKVRHA